VGGTQCLRCVSVVKGLHEECGVWLTCGFKSLLLHVGGESGTIIPQGCIRLQTQLYLMDGTQLLLLWLNLQASSCCHPFAGTVHTTLVASSLACRACLMPSRICQQRCKYAFCTQELFSDDDVPILPYTAVMRTRHNDEIPIHDLHSTCWGCRDLVLEYHSGM
jgi:hypothetical protein